MGAPAAPVNLTATAVSPTKIGLSWHNPEAFDDVIFVERKPGGGGWAALATINGTDESYNDTSCGDGTLYSYRVRGRNDTGEGYEYSGYSNEADAITHNTRIVSRSSRARRLFTQPPPMSSPTR